MTNSPDSLSNYMDQVTSGMRESLDQVVRAHIATTVGNEKAIKELAEGVFRQSPESYDKRAGETWIDAILRRAIESKIKDIVDELLEERQDELRNAVAEKFKSLELAEVAAGVVMKKFESFARGY